MSTRSSRRSLRKPVALLASLALLVVLAGCSGGSGAGVGLTVTDAWVRLPAGSSTTTAAYLVIKNGGTTADALTGASSNAAGMVSVHQTGMDSSGMMGMTPVDRIEIAPGATVTLEQGGYHIMLEGLTRTLAVGQKIELTLTFEKAGTITVSAEVRGS